MVLSVRKSSWMCLLIVNFMVYLALLGELPGLNVLYSLLFPPHPFLERKLITMSCFT
jgi:hypothetical protein